MRKEIMENGNRASCRAHCLVLPYPAQGHINPMIQFSKRLEHRGIKITLITTYFTSKSIYRDSSSSIGFETISDGCDEGGIEQAGSFEAYKERFWEVGPRSLIQLVERMNGSGFFVDCIVYDSFLPWGLDVAKKFGLVGAAFLTQSCAVESIYYHVNKGFLKLPLTEHGILLPGLPPLEPQDMPSFLYNFGSYPGTFDMIVSKQFSNIDKADWFFCNTFYELEGEVAEWLKKLLSLRAIGPAVPSMHLDKRPEGTIDHDFNIFKPNPNDCMEWLNDRARGSVVYVSFGSVAGLKAEEIEELAWGLKASDKYFLWVVRESEQAKLPRNFVEETNRKGLVVSWCPQLKVLGHKAIGCFVTHCGWNSILEALSSGVPMVAVPQFADQPTNAKYITDVWKIGLKAAADEKGIVRREEIEHYIAEILEGKRGKEIRYNADKWRKLAEEAMANGGSSDKSIDEFVAHLICTKS